MDDFFTQLGPDMAQNLHQHRPYYLLPLRVGALLRTGATRRELYDRPNTEDSLASAQERAMDRIKAFVGKGKPISDVYVLSHGWHRNFYSAVSAYDRLSSRWAVLLRRGRLPLPSEPPAYNPLLITLHWSSEIGSDGWVDLAGRRDKPSFIENAAGYWDDAAPGFLDTMEEVFELFSALCAPDTDALDVRLVTTSGRLWTALQALPLKSSVANLAAPERVALVWKCYHEATPKGVHAPQQTQPKRFADYLLRLELVIKFLVATGLLVAVLPRLLSAILPVAKAGSAEFLQGWAALPNVSPSVLGSAMVLGAWAVSLLALALAGWISRSMRHLGHNYGLGWVSLIPWAVAQIGCALPLLVFVLLLYLLPSWVATATGLYKERLTSPKGRGSRSLTERLCAFARWPNRIMKGALEPDSLLKSLSSTFESQLAFYQMQNRGVDAGEEATRLIRELFAEAGLKEARLHLFGHSFGGLLVANLARALARGDSEAQPVPVHSLTFIEGAFASSWLEKERGTVGNVTRTLASFFSGYDSATGFYYPLANAARLSAGSVGLCHVPDPSSEGLLAEFKPNQSDPYCAPTCSANHVHRSLPFASLADPPHLPGPATGLSVLNLDASRMVYAGSPASGGAHTDIYKDDVVNLLWAVAHR